jgi:hypothetical protein
MTDIASFQFKDPSRSFAEGYEQANALRADRGQMQAGQALQTGDYGAASNALLGSGDIAHGLQVRAIGDAKAAAPAAQAAAQKAQLLALTASSAQRLADYHRQTGDTAKTVAAFDQITPQFKQLGETDDDLAQVRASLMSDPETTLIALGAGVAKEQGNHIEKVGDDLIVTDPKGNILHHYRGATSKVVGQGQDLYRMPGQYGEDPTGAGAPPAPNGGAISPAGAIASSAGPDPDAVWRSIKTQESGGLAHPGSAVGPDTQYGNAFGSTQMLPKTAESMARKLGIAWNPAMMRADTPAALAYQDKLGRAYFDEGMEKGGGDPAAGAAYYFGGPDPALHGPKTKAYVQQVMARAGGPAPYEVASNGPTPGPPSDPNAPQLLVSRPPKAKPEEDTTVDDNIVKGLIEGRISPPTQKAAATPYWQAQLQAATQADPTFDGVNFQARQKTRNDFTSGKAADNIRALNTVVGHLDELDRSIDGLGNYEGFLGSHLNNALAQSIAGASNTDQRVKNFETAKTAVANELTRVFRGTGGAEADIQAWQKQLDAASGPTALHSVVKRMANLINSRVGALGDQYNAGMGTTHDPLTLLTPEKQKSFTRMMGDDTGASSSAASPEIQQARAAIAKGADRAKVIQRLREHNIDPAGL